MIKLAARAGKWPGRRKNFYNSEKKSLEMKALLKAEKLGKSLLILLENLENSLESQRVQGKFPRWLSRKSSLLKRVEWRQPRGAANSRWAARPSTVVSSLLRAVADTQDLVSDLTTPPAGQTRQPRDKRQEGNSAEPVDRGAISKERDSIPSKRHSGRQRERGRTEQNSRLWLGNRNKAYFRGGDKHRCRRMNRWRQSN